MISINGKTYTGDTISIINGRVIIDGVLQKDEPLSGVVKIEITGDLAKLISDSNVIVNGNVQGDVDAGGNVSCGNVGGEVDAGGNVTCLNVEGDVDAGGNVSCKR